MTFVSISLPQKYQKWTPSQVLQVVEVDTMEEPGEEKKATCGSQDAWNVFMCREDETKKKVMEDTKDVAIFFTDSPVGIKRIWWKVFVYTYVYTTNCNSILCLFPKVLVSLSVSHQSDDH